MQGYPQARTFMPLPRDDLYPHPKPPGRHRPPTPPGSKKIAPGRRPGKHGAKPNPTLKGRTPVDWSRYGKYGLPSSFRWSGVAAANTAGEYKLSNSIGGYHFPTDEWA